MFKIKSSADDVIKIMRDRATAQQISSDNLAAYEKRVRLQNIATVTGYVVGVVAGASAVMWSLKQSSKPTNFEDEN